MYKNARIIVAGSYAKSLIGFRGDMIGAFIQSGAEVHVCAPEISADAETTRKLEEIGALAYDIPISRTGLNPISDLKTFFALFKLVRLVKPTHVFAYTIKPVIYGMTAAAFCKVPTRVALITGLGYVFTEKPTGLKRYLRTLVRRLYRIALKDCHSIIFQNPDDRRLFVRLGLTDERRSHLINGSGINTREFEEVPVPSAPIMRFLLIARLLKDKGVVEYAAAARIIKAKHPSVEFGLVGWLDKNPSCIDPKELDSWIRSGVINYYGELDDVRPVLAKSSVYVLPSYREGIPRTVLEAMATGRAIITTDAPGCRETVTHGENGFLVPVKNVEALVEAMEKFVLSHDLTRKMGARSRQISMAKYDVDKVNRDIMQYMGLD